MRNRKHWKWLLNYGLAHKLFLPSFIFIHTIALCQKSAGVEQYVYTHQPSGGNLVPAAWYQGTKGWYTSVRYNYEDVQTISALFGKNWSLIDSSLSFTPMAGLLYGNTKGSTIGAIAEYQKGIFTLTAEPQYVAAFTGRQDDFFYNWTELNIDINKRLFAGLALQHTILYRQQADLEPGIFTGIAIKKFTIPFYYFKRKEGNYFVMGVSWEWEKR